MTKVGAPRTWYDQLHTCTAMVGLICLPVAGLRLALGFRADPRWQSTAILVRVLSAVSLVGIAAFLATFVPVASPFWLLGARQYSGITERIPLAANIALLATLAAAVLRIATRPAHD